MGQDPQFSLHLIQGRLMRNLVNTDHGKSTKKKEKNGNSIKHCGVQILRCSSTMLLDTS